MQNEEIAKRIYAGDKDLLAELYPRNIALINIYAKNYYNRHTERLKRRGIEFDDMLNESYFALPAAVQAYCESGTSYKFTSFLRYPLWNCFNQLAGYRTQAEGKEPLNSAVSLDTPMADDEDITLGDTLEDKDANFEARLIERVDMAGVWNIVNAAVPDNSKRNMLVKRFVYGMSYNAIAGSADCSPSYVRTVIAECLRTLRRSREIKAYLDEYIAASYHMGSLARFNTTWESSVEWAVIQTERMANNK